MDKIAFLDLETTGNNPKDDQIVQIAIIVKSWPQMETIVEMQGLVKPLIPIKGEAIAVHGITPAMVDKKPTFKDLAFNILEVIDGCAIAGFNSNIFDVPILFNEFARAGITWNWKNHPLIDVGNIYKEYEKRTLSAGAKFYLGIEHDDAHDAMADTIVTAGIFEEQVKRYSLSTDLKELELISNFGKKKLDLAGVFYYGDDGEIYIGIGSAKGKKAKSELSFVGWIYKNNFPSDVHEVCREILGYTNRTQLP